MTTGRPVLVVEVPRASPSQTSAELGEAAARLAAWGADALSVVRASRRMRLARARPGDRRALSESWPAARRSPVAAWREAVAIGVGSCAHPGGARTAACGRCAPALEPPADGPPACPAAQRSRPGLGAGQAGTGRQRGARGGVKRGPWARACHGCGGHAERLCGPRVRLPRDARARARARLAAAPAAGARPLSAPLRLCGSRSKCEDARSDGPATASTAAPELCARRERLAAARAPLPCAARSIRPCARRRARRGGAERYRALSGIPYNPIPRAQVAEAKEAGAAGVLGIVASVSGRGAPVCSSYAAALGLDSPVEVRRRRPPIRSRQPAEAGPRGGSGCRRAAAGSWCRSISSRAALRCLPMSRNCRAPGESSAPAPQVVNLNEMRTMEAATVNFFAVNVAVGISLARVPGFSAEVARGILGALPFAASSLVGVRSVAEAAQVSPPGWLERK